MIEKRHFRAVFGALIIGFVSIIAISDEGAEEEFVPGEDGWVSLFDGTTLRGWKAITDGDWTVKDGVLTGGKGELLNRWHWVDFELVTIYRGSGVIRFRVGSDQLGHIGFDQPGYRLDIGKGTLHAADGKVVASAEGGWGGDRWRTLRLTAEQSNFTIYLDGKKAIEGADTSSPAKGRVGFAGDGDGLQVKYLRIRPLGLQKKKNIPADNYYCYVCHADFEEEPLALIHQEKDVGCADCHGSCLPHRSDEDNITPPDVMYRRGEVYAACLRCHKRHEAKEISTERPLPENPVCTDCHGTHRTSH